MIEIPLFEKPANAQQSDPQPMQCMEVWGGSELTSRGVAFGGLEAWVYSKPYANARDGGDVYYASSCATGRISRFLLADVAGHGDAVAETANGLKRLMRRFVNRLDQAEVVRLLNRQFAELAPTGIFATAIVATFFAPSRRLSLCNAGHPRPLLYRAGRDEWVLLSPDDEAPSLLSGNIPFGIFDLTEYEHFDVELESGDCILAYTDVLIEASGPDGQILGEEGLLQLVRGLRSRSPKELAEELLRETNARCPDSLSCDDVTIMVLRASGRSLNFSLKQKVDALRRFARTLVATFRPHAERPPFPDFNLANLAGAIIPALAKRWRPARN